jgi:hypothetical protein
MRPAPHGVSAKAAARHRIIPVSILPVSILPVSILPVSILPVSILPVSILPVSILPVSILPVSILPVSILPRPPPQAGTRLRRQPGWRRVATGSGDP